MRTRVITAVIALLIFIPIIWYGGLLMEGMAALLGVVGVYELFRMKGLVLNSFEGVLAALGTMILILPKVHWLFFLPEKTDTFILFYGCVLFLLTGLVISKNSYTIAQAGFPVIVSLYVGVGFQNFVRARQAGFVVLLFALLIVWATDIGAYMIGRRFGRHKLIPEISPNKTIEGAVGGVCCAVFVAGLFLLLVPYISPQKAPFPYPIGVLLGFTLVFSIVGQLGDLVESSIKRHYQVKDSGNLLPGHGGILDRFDSLLFVFPVMHLFGLF